jgi:hypothetical protein
VAEPLLDVAPPQPAAAAVPADAPPAPVAPGLTRALVVFTIVLLPFFLPALLPDRQFGYFDDGRMHVPMKRWIAEELRRGHLPEWNPYAGLGTPVIAGGVDAVLHPFNLLLVALPFDLGFKLWVLLFYPLAATGAYAWARRLGIDGAAAIGAGLAFALSGYAVSLSGNMQYLGALALFPWILAAAHAFVERPGAGRGALVVLASGLCAASGDPQGWGLALALVPLATLALPPAEGRLRGGLRAAGVLALAIAGAAPTLFPTLAWIPHSGRGEAFDPHEYEQFNLLPVRALELAIPHLFRTGGPHLSSELYETAAGSRWTPFPWALSEYTGITVVALALLGAIRDRRARLLALAAAVATWMATGPAGGFGLLARKLPVLSSLRYWEKVCAWPPLFLALAAGLGLVALRASTRDARGLGRALLVLAAGLGAAGLACAAGPALAAAVAPAGASAGVVAELRANLRDGLLHAGAFSGALGAAALLLARGRLPRPALALAAICVLDLAAANVRAYVLFDVSATRPASTLATHLRAEPGVQRLLTPFGMFLDGRRFEAPMEEAWRVGAESLYAAWNVPEHVGNFEIYSGMRPVRSNRFWRRAGRGNRLPGVELWGFGWIWAPPDLSPDAARLIPPEAVPALGPPHITGELFRVPARPRVYLAAELASVDRRGAMEFALDHASSSSARSVVEGPLPPGYASPDGAARLVADRSERVELEATTDRPGLLVLNDEFTVGWSAEVDGTPAEIVPVNYLARGVWLGPGTHRVTYRYRTPGLREGALALAAAMAALAGWALVRARRARSAA